MAGPSSIDAALSALAGPKAPVSFRQAIAASEAKDADRLLERLSQQGLVRYEMPRPQVDPKSQQLARISDRIERKYASGDYGTAERWDARLEDWMERKDSHLHGMDEGPEVSGGYDDAATGVSGQAADAYADLLAGRLEPEDLPSRVIDMAYGNLEGPMRPPAAADLMDFARQMHSERMALRARQSQPPPEGLKVLTADELIRRLGAQQP